MATYRIIRVETEPEGIPPKISYCVESKGWFWWSVCGYAEPGGELGVFRVNWFDTPEDAEKFIINKTDRGAGKRMVMSTYLNV
jgi:hypothetical protein